MSNNIPVHSYSGNKLTRSHRPNMLLFFCLLFSLFCVLFFSACATTPSTKDINKAEAYNKLGASYLNNGQTNNAYVEFQKAINLNPKNKETLNYLGYINTTYKKYDEAIVLYKRAISIDPKYSDAMHNLGILYIELEKWDKAISSFNAALENPLYRTPERSYTSMGYAYYMNNNYHKAENSLRQALMRNPVYPLANYTLGLVYIKLADDEKAIKEFINAIAISPEYINAHWELAQIYLRRGANAKALKHLGIVAEKGRNIERNRMAIDQIEKLKY
ncbi:lipoprotein NlpI [bacterium BMS3Bbin09]|nr:lipoprotein NlpI [bacterium BMS3Bbin09]